MLKLELRETATSSSAMRLFFPVAMHTTRTIRRNSRIASRKKIWMAVLVILKKTVKDFVTSRSINVHAAKRRKLQKKRQIKCAHR